MQISRMQLKEAWASFVRAAPLTDDQVYALLKSVNEGILFMECRGGHEAALSRAYREQGRLSEMLRARQERSMRMFLPAMDER